MTQSVTAVLIVACSSIRACAWRVRPSDIDAVLACRPCASSALRPINAAIHARITEALGDELPHGLPAHVAIARADGHLSKLDPWDTRADGDTYTEQGLHPGRVVRDGGDLWPPAARDESVSV